MNRRSGRIRAPWLVALMIAALAVPEMVAVGSMAGHSGARGGHPHRQSMPRRPNRGPNPNSYAMPHAGTSSRANNNMARTNSANGYNNQTHLSNASSKVKTGGGTVSTRSASVAGIGSTAMTPNSYSYGTGKGTRQYHAYGNGRGSRNRSGSYRQGRSQGNNRAVVSRLRSVHAGLARLDHDYKGHRVRAMHSVSTAVRLLSHRSPGLNPNGNGNVGNANGLAMRGNNGGNRATGRGAANNVGARRATPMTQAQSDSQMSLALRTTQGIHRQMSSQASYSSTHSLARNHVARATRELHTALTTR